MSKFSIPLSRAVKATRIPSGETIQLAGGTEVFITQALGGSYTVTVPGEGGLYRIDQDFADALGQETIAITPSVLDSNDPITVEKVWDVLKTCYDPEIPVNIVDLGLIYSLRLEPVPDTPTTTVFVEMTLTAPGCGMGPVIAKEAQQKIAALPGVSNADVQVVWTPAWSPDRISDAGKEKLGMI